MSKWVVDIHGDIEGDYEIIKEYEEPKMGHWIEEITYMKCQNCHDIWHYEKNQTERFKCCPTCGAKMEEDPV